MSDIIVSVKDLGSEEHPQNPLVAITYYSGYPLKKNLMSTHQILLDAFMDGIGMSFLKCFHSKEAYQEKR